MTKVERKRNKVTIICDSSQAAVITERNINKVLKLTKKPKILERLGKKLEKRVT